MELKERKDARLSLLNFSNRVYRGFESPTHIQVLCSYLEKVASREITRLMVFMPPRHGKTQATSILFPSWYLGRNPQHQIIGASYAEPLAYNNSRACRDTIKSEPYQILWPHKLDAEGVVNWRIRGKENHRPNYVAAGVGGALTGEGADILLIDDPVKNYEDACSVVMRETNWEWYKTVARTRLQPNAAIILIMTRWHHDDLAGRILRQKRTDDLASNWTLLVLPAEDPDGTLCRPEGVLPPYTSLWPQRYPVKELISLKADIGTRQYSALYGQTPSDEEGAIIKRNWFQYYTEEPAKMAEECTDLIQSWDMAFKDTSDSSYVVGQVWGRRGADKVLLDQVRKRMDFSETCKQVLKMSDKWPRAGRKLVEDKANGPAVINHLQKVVAGFKPMDKDVSKEAALQAASPDFESKNVYIPSTELHPWVLEYIEELVTFGVSAFTDQCDATSQAINWYRGKFSHLLEYMKKEYEARRASQETHVKPDIDKTVTPVVQ
jgi:predicted phage terminase large subunit-like protein